MNEKKHLNLSVDENLIEEAKRKFINLSDAAEDGIRERLGKVIKEIDTNIKNCEFCGIEMEKQTKNDLTKGLVWLCPDEKWICPKCLQNKINKAINQSY